jgi:hypothetical protein
VFWLNLNYGERQTYDLLQRLADDQLRPIHLDDEEEGVR